ncbi:MAG: DUF4189 domain-containing protein [Pseudomonadota bacterium]
MFGKNVTFAALAVTMLPLAAYAQSYGAIAYSIREPIYGWAAGANSKRQAENAAVQNCRNAGGSNCVGVIYVENSCGAVADYPGNLDYGRLGVSWGAGSKNQAVRAARNACNSQNGRGDCEVPVYVCSIP